MLKCLVNFMAIWTLVGCSINGTGLVKLQYFENGSVYIISKETWGGHLSTYQTDAGITFGHAKRIFFYPKNNKSIELSIDDLLTKVQQDKFIEIEKISIEIANTEPIAWITNNQGMMLHTNQFQFGFKLGVETRDMIRLPRDFNGVFVLNTSEHKNFKALHMNFDIIEKFRNQL